MKNRKTIEKDEHGDWCVYEHGVYERRSMLHGQPRRCYLDEYKTVEEAKQAHPNADVIEGTSRPYQPPVQSLADLSGLPKCPPSDFDPADAGEHWDDDY